MRKRVDLILITALALLFHALAWGSVNLDISTGTKKSNTTSNVSQSTSTAFSNELVLIACAGNTSTPKIPTTTSGLTISTVTTSLQGGYAGLWATCTSSTFSNQTFTCNSAAAASQLAYVVSSSGTACSPGNPLAGIGAITACTGDSGTTATCSYTSTYNNSWGISAGQDASNGDTITASANETFLITYTTDTFSANTEWVSIQNALTATSGSTVSSVISGLTSGGGSISQVIAEVIPTTSPIVTTGNTSSVGYTTATGSGTVWSGGSNLTDSGLCVSIVSNPTTSDTCISQGTTEGSFTENFTGLMANQLYHIRAYGTNTLGTSYGNDRTFYTPAYNGAYTVSGVGKATVSGTGGTVTIR